MVVLFEILLMRLLIFFSRTTYGLFNFDLFAIAGYSFCMLDIATLFGTVLGARCKYISWLYLCITFCMYCLRFVKYNIYGTHDLSTSQDKRKYFSFVMTLYLIVTVGSSILLFN